MPFVFDASALKGEAVVVFEDLYDGEKLVAVHAEIDDQHQTVYFPELGTTATTGSGGKRTTTTSTSTTILDVIHFKGLKPNTEVKYVGVLYDTATNKPLLVNGKEVRAEKTNSSQETEGDVQMTFTFDSTGLEGKSVTVFEYAYVGDLLIAQHTDITSEKQTISFSKKPDTPKTGDKAKPILMLGIMLFAGATLLVTTLINRRKKQSVIQNEAEDPDIEANDKE